MLERGTIIAIVAFMVAAVTTIVEVIVVVVVESKTEEETEVCTDGGEERCGKGMAFRAIRVEFIGEENFNVFKALISS